MKHTPQHSLTKPNREQKRGKRWQKIVGAMAAVVVFCTTYAMILPALTLENDASEDVVPAAVENVTVDFVIDNENYTNDSGSDETHITTSSDMSDANGSNGLVFTQPSGWTEYQVTGTGTLVSFTIPAGTSLADNECSLPSISVTNIGSGNTASYLSTLSWVTSNGMICNANTTFDSDTELDLSLYQEGENCSLEYVCGDEKNHSVTYVVSGYPNATYKLGQSVSDPYILTAEDMDAKYTCSWCSHGSKSNEVFDGWFLKDTNGNEVPFKAGVALTEQYLDPDATNSIKVYAHWKDAAAEETTYTVAFVYGDETIEIRSVDERAALGELPDMSDYESDTARFVGWQDTEGNVVTADTVVTANMTLTAVFRDPNQVEYYKVFLYDIDPDGNKSEVILDLSVEEGTTLADALAEGGATLEDGTAAADCIWHIESHGEVVDLNEAVTSDMQLYTYTYKLTLTLEESQSVLATVMSLFTARSVDISEDGNTLTLILRENEKPSYSDFVIDGIDYSLVEWTYTTDGSTKTLDIPALIANGATENITASAAASSLPSKANATVQFYVCINGDWTLRDDYTTSPYGPATFANNNSRFYVTSAQLEAVYGEFGFSASNYTGTLMFPHADAAQGDIWGDVAPIAGSNGLYLIPVGSAEGKTYKIYYTPSNNTYNDIYSGSVRVYPDGIAAANSFYTVTVSDITHKYYKEDEIPAVQYVFTGGSTTVTLEGTYSDWKVSGVSSEDNVKLISSNDGSCTLEISEITHAIDIHPGGTYVKYVVAGSFEKIGSYGADNQEWNEDAPTVKGEASLVEVAADGYSILSPDRLTWVSRANYYSNGQIKGDMLFTYTFQGWKLESSNGDAIILAAGESLTENLVSAYKDDSDYVTLTSIWTANYRTENETANRYDTVSFFVIIDSNIADTEDSTDETPSGNYSDAVFTTNVINGDKVTLAGNNQTKGTLIVGSSTTSAVEVDANIRKLASAEGYDSNGETIQIGELPTDEQVFTRLRTWSDRYTEKYANSNPDSVKLTITVNGVKQEISPNDLTTENYTIRWFVFKYDDSDGWHIDGILVPKAGKLTINKTFYGNSDAIAAVKKNGYTISVDPANSASASESDTAPSYTLSLEKEGDEANGQIGYSYYDKDTDTYTWVLDVRQKTEYKLTENSYQYTDSSGTIATLSEYLITNSSDANVGKWQTYNSTTGVTVTARSYATDLNYTSYQTVSFMNSYLNKGSMLVHKVDEATGASIGGVSFRVTNSKEETQPVWKAADGSNKYYLYDPGNEATENDNGLVTGNKQGVFEIVGLKSMSTGGVYWLKEDSAPTGYSSITEPIKLAISDKGAVTLEKHSNATLTSSSDGAYILRITNESKKSKVIVQKIWTDNTGLPVTIELRQNGTLVDTVTLTADGYIDAGGVSHNDGTPWYCEFVDLPLYVGDSPAEYTIQEKWIGTQGSGGTAYDQDADSDGFANYVVTYDDIVYVFGSDNAELSEPFRLGDDGVTINEYASMAKLVVRNAVDNGDVAFKKVDQNGNPLPGAKFTLYSDSGRATQVATAVSGEDGVVRFSGLKAGTTYYMLETAAPDGYVANADMYVVDVKGTASTIYKYGDTTKTAVTQITNNAGVELPQTGGIGTHWYTLGGALLLALALVCGFMLRRKPEGGDGR